MTHDLSHSLRDKGVLRVARVVYDDDDINHGSEYFSSSRQLWLKEWECSLDLAGLAVSFTSLQPSKFTSCHPFQFRSTTVFCLLARIPEGTQHIGFIMLWRSLHAAAYTAVLRQVR